ncbi:MAG: molybdenum cofactor guanylyltransferase [Edaphobacter sp.]
MTSGVNGYVLAGGKSSRMGRDKALLELAGKPLILRAVEKLQRVGMDVYVLSNRPELGAYAPLVRDLHKGCGPLGGVEAALFHSTKAWNLFMAVDMPFLPSGFLSAWMRMVVGQVSARVAMFTVEGRPQPALCLLHKDVAPYVFGAVKRGEFRLLLALEAAAKELAVQQGVGLERVLLNLPWDEEETALFCKDGTGWTPTEAQQVMRYLWFANLNTPQELAAVEGFAGALEVD